ncbi:helix-turn-helix domain-containing protein [Nocardioides marinquilinus]|uniref:helix-turn-helix domain-containing protein n=1 Tax=Nocardioides marinquilinus TaxID=1210400 RepID=UPI0031E9D5D7
MDDDRAAAGRWDGDVLPAPERGRAGTRFDLRPGDVPQLSAWAATSSALGIRSRVVLLSARGLGPTQVAGAVGVSRQTAHQWRTRYLDEGLDGLLERALSPRREVDDASIVAATLRSPASSRAGGRWSCRMLAEHLGVGRSTVSRAWRRYGVHPHGAGTYRFATRPGLTLQVGAVLGVVVARDVRLLAISSRPAGTTPATRHAPSQADGAAMAVRLGPIQLLAALRAALAEPAQLTRRGALDLERFLRLVARLQSTHARACPDLTLVTDSPGVAGHPEVRALLARHGRAQVAITDDSEHWLRLVQVCLGLAEQPALARGASGCADDLTGLMRDLVTGTHVLPGPFVWTDRVRRPTG